jgi:hypothetical protein
VTEKTILLHICCGPCAIYPLKRLREQGFSVTGYFYNHNIHPFKEYQRRLDTAQQFASDEKLELIIGGGYELEEFLMNTAGRHNERCEYCYESRLGRTADYAKECAYALFTTTLLVSPYQKHNLLIAKAEVVAQSAGVGFFYEDFRSGWDEGVSVCRSRGYYRQPYCGCIYSEKERYLAK